MSSSQIDAPADGALSAAISNAVVGLLHDYTGRGPTRARTHIATDLITVVLEDTLTKGERSLVADGKSELVLGTRYAYQQTMRTDLVAVVEARSGRQVRAFLSDNHLEPDIAVECFVLEPVADA
jgi:uncharacterized protein YbcI